MSRPGTASMPIEELPLSVGVGTTATGLILGSNGVAGVSAAGVLLTATGTLGAVGYGGLGARRPLLGETKEPDHGFAPRDTPASTSVDLAPLTLTTRARGLRILSVERSSKRVMSAAPP